LLQSNPAEKRILLVEDDSRVAKILEEMLTRIGYLVTGTAIKGDEAIAMAAERYPYVILMDIHLPGEMDGIETAQRIKGLYGTPIIFLIGDNNDETIKRAVMAESYGYLVKPVNIKELFANIEIAIHKNRKIDPFKEPQVAAGGPVCPCDTPMVQIFSSERDVMVPAGWVCPRCYHFVRGV
jgi:DNA-binding response OmpR family regulator